MQQTSNYNMNKPAQTDVIDIDDLNTNFDTLDAELKKVSDKANLIPTAGGTGTAITLTNVTLVNGFTITFIVAANNNGAATTINGKSLYKPGGTTVPKLIAGKAVTVWYNGTNFFIKASAEGDSVVGNVLAGKTFSNDDDTGLTGTMPNNGPISAETINLTAEGAEYTIPAGYHSGLRKMKAVITGLIASVIKAGVTVGGILGTFTSDATATAGQMLSGAIAYVNGNKITGTIASKTSQTYTPGTTNQTIAAGQYLSGIQTIAGDADLIGANIKAGANIFGVAGKTSVVDTADANLSDSGWLLTGATAYKNGVKITGSMPNNATAHTEALAADGTIWGGRIYLKPKAGYYNGAYMVYFSDADYVPANILSTANIFGVQGSIPDRRADYVNALAYSPYPTVLYSKIPEGYYDGEDKSWLQQEDPDFLAANILNTANIFGMQGTAVAGKRYASGSFVSSSGSLYTYTLSNGTTWESKPMAVSGIGFTPSIIVMVDTATGWHVIFANNRIMLSNRTDIYIPLASPAYVNGTGFSLPNPKGITGTTTYLWYAFE